MALPFQQNFSFPRNTEHELKTNKELSIIRNYFNYENKLQRNGVIVECGTAEGWHDPGSFLEKNLNWKFIGFEVDPIFWPQLCLNKPSALKINKALNNFDGQTKFTVSAWGGNSSLNHSKEHKKELEDFEKTFQDGSYFKEITVPSITWKTFVKQYKILKVDLFILDVEGCELRVLEGMKNCDIMPDIMLIEFSRADYNDTLMNKKTKEDFSGFKIIKDNLNFLGYDFDYVEDNNAAFSKRDFWENKTKPVEWIGESTQFGHLGFIRYDKEKCKNL